MPEDEQIRSAGHLGGCVSNVAAVFLTGAGGHSSSAPTTTAARDDAEVFAISSASCSPEVDGPITQLAVQDNQFVRGCGSSCSRIDPRPYICRAREEQGLIWPQLECQISDERRTSGLAR